MDYYKILEFDSIKEKLAEYALSAYAKEKAISLAPTLNEVECKKRLTETTEAKEFIESMGSPPLSSMENLDEIISVTKLGGMLQINQLNDVYTFLATSKRMKKYLAKGEFLGSNLSSYSLYINSCDQLMQEINGAIDNEMITDNASSELKNIRRKLENVKTSIESNLAKQLKSKAKFLSDNYITNKHGHFVLPVKKEYKHEVSGSVIDISGSGSTYFIEPSSISDLTAQKGVLEIEEDNEKIRILYLLTAMVEENLSSIEANVNYFKELDFQFAKAKLSLEMEGNQINVSVNREINIVKGRHPLIAKKDCVPLDFKIESDISGVIITGSNTGGKTVALKTIGLLSIMHQSGLHVPADKNSTLSMNNYVLCDIGDGQSINQNLSTFSSHLKNIIEILKMVNDESLVLLDELGSGTDPSEGSGLAVAILEELLVKKCLFVVTTHYSSVKDFAKKTKGIVNARMAFDAENLKPTYRLEMGESGESYAFHIAHKFGLEANILNKAHHITYGKDGGYSAEMDTEKLLQKTPKIVKEILKAKGTSISYNVGDSVKVMPEDKIAIVFKPADDMGMVGIQLRKKKQFINQKRLKLNLPAEQLYPDDYDFSIIFDSVANRKMDKNMTKRHNGQNIIVHEDI